MTYRNDLPLTRRAWLMLAGLAATGCGGGSTTALPGTGGTGAVFAQGSISGFGSVIVNGIKFDDLQAQVSVDGAAAASADLRLGMVAEIQGMRGADLTLGTASSIEVWSMAQGVVDGLIPGGFVLSGMSILCDTTTALDGLHSVAEVAVGQTLAVWGLQSSADAGRWQATRLALLAPTARVVTSGLVQMMGSTSMLNGLLLRASADEAMKNAALVRVEGALSEPGVLQVSRVRAMSMVSAGQTEGGVQLEGYVTDMTTARRFKLGQTDVDASAADMQAATTLKLGDRVEVSGNWRSGVLMAERVAVETEDDIKLTEITATVSSYTSVADFVLRDQRCDASRAVFEHGTADDLRRQGVLVKVKGTRSGSVLLVGTVEFEN